MAVDEVSKGWDTVVWKDSLLALDLERMMDNTLDKEDTRGTRHVQPRVFAFPKTTTMLENDVLSIQ